ncbi:hypothetical protein BT93_L3589 [Corymbia citriodora subsp. variegata]|uniref:Cystatin domain-containing protein n=1 Tax=Corymbia citriodora subsp. variegata TaxID=360336 RepID=A0A8T0CJE1_CORYI|nr:hypothetical protein BT93_L3589 [Corymbia citriodora subsp. variegata]
MRLLILAAAAILLLLKVSASGPYTTELLVVGWNPIKNLSDPYTHNDEAKTGLVLEKVVGGDTQVVSGTGYRLVIEVKDGAKIKNYVALVWDQSWKHFRRLLSFKPFSLNV